VTRRGRARSVIRERAAGDIASMRLPARSPRAVLTALAVAAIAAPVATAHTVHERAMSAADVRDIQSQGVREIVVERKASVSAVERTKLRADAGVRYVRPGPLANTEIDRAPSGGLTAAVAALRRDPQVQYAEPNGEVHATSTSNDPYFGLQWGLANTGQSVMGTHGTPGDDIDAAPAWPQSTGAGVTVAVVDTGVDPTAPDLAGQTVSGASFLNGVSGASTQDNNGHGTHVTGIIVAIQNNGAGVSGVAPGAKVMPLQAMDANESGSVADVAAAFNYAGQHNIRIVNASLGATTTSQTLEQSITSNPNTLYVVAAGNNATNDDSPSTPFYPCDLSEPNLICVGATDQNDQPASFTNYGATSVDLFAPGVNIVSTWTGGRYAYASGTSMAAPMVSGTLALMLAEHRSLTAAQLKAELFASVKPERQLAGLSVTGGELDAAAAVAAQPPVGAAAPSPSAATGAPPQAPITATRPASPSHPGWIMLTNVAVRKGRGGLGLVFALSAQARVQITVRGPVAARGAIGRVRTSVRGHRGKNRYALTSLLHGRHVPRGRYSLTIRAGGRAVVIKLKVA
jgi:thermitase